MEIGFAVHDGDDFDATAPGESPFVRHIFGGFGIGRHDHDKGEGGTDGLVDALAPVVAGVQAFVVEPGGETFFFYAMD